MATATEKQNATRKSIRQPLIVAAIGVGLCAAAFMLCGLIVYWNSAKLINFLAAWIPFAFSVLFAFVPSAKEMKHEWTKWVWRSGVVVIGFAWSVMLWHQQDLIDQSSTNQISSAVGAAVQQANEHSDGKFGEAKRQIDELGSGLHKDIAQGLSQAEKDLGASIGKVGKPDPPEKAKLVFSLWSNNASYSNFPIESENLSPDANGIYHIQFVVKNDSSVAAQGIEVWVAICDSCEFAGEQKGFDHFAGMGERERHRSIPSMNSGTNLLEGNELTVRPKLGPRQPFAVSFRSACNTCGPEVDRSRQFWIHPMP